MIIKKTYAKVILGLDIEGRKDDRYHLVRMIMQTFNIYDELSFEKTENPDIYITSLIDSEDKDGKPLSLGKDYLIYNAVGKIIEASGY